MKITIVCFSRAWGGLEMKLVELARLLKARGHHLLVVAPPDSPLIEESTLHQLLTFAMEPRFRYLDFFASRTLRGALRRHGSQIVITGLSKDISTVLLAVRPLQTASLVFIQQMHFGLRKKDLFHRWAYGGIDLWLTLTSHMREAVLENTTVAPGKVRAFPFGSDLKAFSARRYRKEKERKHFRLPQKRPIVGVIGRLDPQKGQQYFLQAIPHIARLFPKCSFVIAGDETKNEPGFRDHLITLARELQVDNRVTFLPFTSDVPRLLSAIDVLVLPSLNETFGYILIEAMAMGVNVIGTNAGGVPEIIEDGTTGLLIAPADSLDLADKVNRMLTNKRLQSGLARRARQRALTQFDLGRQIEELEKLLAEIHSVKKG